MTPEITMLWGKTDRSSGRYHPLLCHMLDVAAVAECLWDDVLPLDVRLRVARGLGVSEDVARAWIVLWAALHDLGKACPAFQSKDPNCLRRLAACGLAVQAAVREPAHGVVTALSLGELSRDLGLSKQIAVTAGMVAGGHHGVFPRSGEIADQRHHNDAIGGITWSNTRKAIVDALVKMLDTPVALAPQHVDGPTAMIVAGLISVADWIGSSEEHFSHLSTEPDRAPDLDPGAYLTRARDRARDALVALGWNAWPSAEGQLSFQQLFQHIDAPNGLQREAIRLADEIAGPALVVIEAPMGEGKTEAAMYLADRWAARSGRKGCYFALPTQATSDQMFARVRDFLAARYPRELVQLQLLHGHAALSAELAALKARSHLLRPGGVFGEPGYDGADAGVVAGEWFTHRKRGLLAPFGVGTVDQALLAVLQTRHVFVRLFGLAGKTVVVDEVHSYDAYMTELLDRLLEWLGALGCSVVLLSATLPRSRRTKLVAAYQRGLGMDQGEAQNTRSSYPRLTWTSASGSGTRPFETSRRSTKRLRIEWVDGRIPEGDEPFSLGERLKEALAEGGCAAVVCNTVRRAQTVYTALKRYFLEVGPDGLPRELDLLHARYPFEERERREQRALVRFGKPGGKVHMADGATEEVRRPRRAVLVSTQIVEQSLDLDFDLMVSDLAPVDLLLQRSGRLHRHPRPGRPPALSGQPRLWLVRPEQDEEGVPAFDEGSEAVYDGHVLLRSWLALRDTTEILVPDDVERLVEEVYGEGTSPKDAGLSDKWLRSRRDLARKVADYEITAKKYRILPPLYPMPDLLEDFNRELEEDKPDVAPSLQALTRLSDPSVRVVLWSDDSHVPGEDGHAPCLRDVVALLRRSVSIADRGLVSALLRRRPPPGWKKSVLLRHHRLIQLDHDGSADLPPYRILLDSELGLVFERQNGR